MSVVIVGGNERMVCQYEDICKGFGCKAKKKSIPVCRCHTSSAAALENILKQYCA